MQTDYESGLPPKTKISRLNPDKAKEGWNCLHIMQEFPVKNTIVLCQINY